MVAVVDMLLKTRVLGWFVIFRTASRELLPLMILPKKVFG